MATEAEQGERLVEQALTALNEADLNGPAQEHRFEAEVIARGIRHEECGGPLLGRKAVAAIVRSVIQEHSGKRLSRKEARAIADRLCALRLVGQLREAISAEAADVLADGRATLRTGHSEGIGEWAELIPARETAAQLHAFVEYEALVNLFIADRLTMEVFSTNPNELLAEVRELVRALIAGEYSEEEREGSFSAKIRARWPPDRRYTYIGGSQDAGPQTEWRRRAYDPY